jgi:hypothetical protein
MIKRKKLSLYSLRRDLLATGWVMTWVSNQKRLGGVRARRVVDVLVVEFSQNL